jgi:uncharacterized membrane protein YsdA (DUF1294 family)
MGTPGALPGAVPVLVGWLVFVNVATAAAYAYDKVSARRGGHRVRERTLLLLDLLGGVGGGWIIFFWMRHKTLHRRFWIVQSIASVLWITILIGLLVA